MTDESRRPNIKPEGGVDPLVSPRGHHSVSLRTNWFTCRTCENQGREEFSWDRSELVDLREEEPPLRDDAEVMTDGGPSADGIFRVECKNEGCGWDFDHRQKRFVTEAADNHEAVYRDHPEDHSTTLPRYVEPATAQNGGEPDGE